MQKGGRKTFNHGDTALSLHSLSKTALSLHSLKPSVTSQPIQNKFNLASITSQPIIY